MAKKLLRFNDKATSPNAIPDISWVTTTKNFLVLNSSRNGLHNGFNVHGRSISDVQNVISLSSTSSPLNISTITILSTTNGSPMAKYAVGIHIIGLLLLFFPLFINSFLSLEADLSAYSFILHLYHRLYTPFSRLTGHGKLKNSSILYIFMTDKWFFKRYTVQNSLLNILILFAII